MKDSLKRTTRVLLAMFLVLGLASCGGGGESSSGGSSSGSSSLADGIVMSWEAPETYSDATSLDPKTDLEEYEIFVNTTGSFDTDDTPAAYVSAVDANGIATESFDLGNLDYSFTAGGTYYICMRSVTTSGVKSDFSGVIPITL